MLAAAPKNDDFSRQDDSRDPGQVRLSQTRDESTFALRLGWASKRLAPALRRTKIPSCDWDDVTQQTLLALWRRRPRLEPLPQDELLAYAWRVVGSVVHKADHTRKRRRGRELLFAAMPSNQAPNPEQQLAQGEATRRRLALLARLPDELRSVIVAGEIDRLTVAEIADRRAVPVGTIKSWRKQARAILQHWAARDARDDT